MCSIVRLQRVADCKTPPSVDGGGTDVGFVHSFNQLLVTDYLLCKLLASSFRIENIFMERKLWSGSCQLPFISTTGHPELRK